MDRFTQRQQLLINELYHSNNFTTGKHLSIKLDVSVRTIQSEISSINKVLPLISSSNRGYTLNKDSINSLKTQFLLKPLTLKHNIIKKLFFTNLTYHIEDLADELYISSSVLDKHLKSLSNELQHFHLSLHKKHCYISILGSEYDKRKFLNKTLIDEINPAFNSIDNLSYYFEGINLEKIKTITLNAINKYHYYLENAYYNNLIINITIALFRMRTSHYVSESSLDMCDDSSNTELKIAKEICTQYSNHYYISPTSEDLFYISNLLKGVIKPITYSTIPNSPDIINDDFVNAIREILMNVFSYYMLELNSEEYIFTFALHIHGLLKRINHMPITDTLFVENIKKNCPFIYDVSVSIVQKLNKRFHVQIHDAEIGYISIHIGYLIESASTISDKVSVLLLCDEYHHISDTIKTKLLENYNTFIDLRILNPDYADTLINSTSDLIITNKQLNIIGKEVIVVSPFFTLMDHINVDNAIHKCLEKKQKNKKNNMLSSIFNEKLFFKMDGFQNKEEVIRFLGQKVIEYGVCDDTFIDSVLARERLSSTCFFNTFAIPHAQKMNAKQTMICVLTSEQGICWDDKIIHIVFLLAVQQSDRKKFMELYNGIVNTLENPEKVQNLVHANDISSFLFVYFLHFIPRFFINAVILCNNFFIPNLFLPFFCWNIFNRD